MSYALINCLPPAYARRIRETLFKDPDTGVVSNKEVMEFLEHRKEYLTNAKENAQLTAVAYANNIHSIMSYTRPARGSDVRAGRAKKKGEMMSDPEAGLIAFLVTDRNESFRGTSVQGKMDGAQMLAFSKLNEMMIKYAPKHLSMSRMVSHQRGLASAFFGDGGSAQDKLFVRAFNKVNDELIAKYNTTEATTGKGLAKEGQTLPTISDYDMVMSFISKQHKAGDTRADIDIWLSAFEKKLDYEAMGVKKGEMRMHLEMYFKDLKTDGFASQILGSSSEVHGNSFQKRHELHRTLKWKDSQGWWDYSQQFSKESPYSGLMDHLTIITRETAMRESLGPSPTHGFNMLRDTVAKAVGTRDAGRMATKAFDNLAGALAPENQRMADTFQSLRNYMTGLKLTSAALSALPDVGFLGLTAGVNGLSVTKMYKSFTSILVANTKDKQRLAASTGFLLEHAIDRMHASSRFATIQGRGFSAKFAEVMMRAGGLNHWTVAAKQAFHLEFAGHLAHVSELAPDVLAKMSKTDGAYKNFLRTLERYGISPEDMAIIGSSTKITKGSTKFMDPSQLPTDLAERVLGMIKSESRYGVTEPDALVQGFMNQGTKRGTATGEALRSSGQFKTFSVSVVMNHLARATRGLGNGGDRAKYMGTMMVSTFVLGMMSVQAKEIAKGNKPLDWDSLLLAKKSVLAGGLLSFAGDIILGNMQQFGQTTADMLGGPLLSELDKIVMIGIFGDAKDVVTADNMMEELVRKAQGDMAGAVRYIPGQFWYWRLAHDRLWMEGLRELADPRAKMKAARSERARRKTEGTNERWWK